MKKPPHQERRLIIVSNRLPFSVASTPGGFSFQETTGGVVTGLSSYLASIGTIPGGPSEYLWIGWPGASIAQESRQLVAARALKEFRSVPVFLSEEDMDRFYLGFCNKTLWPLFHSFPSVAAYEEQMWESYLEVNEKFCDTLLGILKPDDIVWIQDYHLLLLPQLVRRKLPAVHIGFFLHIPFPSHEIFRLLPSAWRKSLLEGLLGADLVGFHTYEYTQNFLQSVLRVLGYANTIGQILLPERGVRADTFPMGIDYERYSQAAASSEVQAEVSRIRTSLGDVRVILSVDRLDYTKGILNRLLGYDMFLEKNPQWHGNVVLVLTVVPSRIGVDQYDLMKRQLEEHVGRINGKYGRIGWTPVSYQYRHVPFEPLVALYALSDVAMVTPLRDGMNLVAKEFVAAQADGRGVLILSEMAGAAKELGEAVLVNPNHSGEIAAAIFAALNLSPDEQERRLRIMQARLKLYTVDRWATDFVQGTLGAVESHKKFETQRVQGGVRAALHRAYAQARRRLILLDYDGTLVPFVDDPSMAHPGHRVLTLVRQLVDDPANHVVIISGRDRRSLERWFDSVPVHLIAEHGFQSKGPDGTWQSVKNVPVEWKVRLQPILRIFADRVPGSTVEEKEYSLVWHYRAADPELGESFAHELVDNLNALTGNIDVQVMQANKAIEVRLAGMNKGSIARDLAAGEEYDFLLAIGDDQTDEEMFAALPESAYSIRVGFTRSYARYSCNDVEEVHRLLSLLTTAPREEGEFGGPIRRAIRVLWKLGRG
jgi:trehalose 6-phosphate synthase/phosphatase